MTVIKILRAAKAKLTPETWAQNDYAFDAAGDLCKPTSPRAVRFCATGAIESLNKNPNARSRTGVRQITLVRLAVSRLNAAAKGMGIATVPSPATWLNDHTDLATVHRMFDVAIETAERAA